MFAKTSTTFAIVVSVVLISVLVTTIPQNDSVYPVSAQMNNSNNNTSKNSMNFAMGELAKLHLMIADQELKNGNTTAAFNQMNLAYLQLAMLGMKDMGKLNETQAMKFMQGGGTALGTKMVPENCILIQGGVLACHDILTGTYSLAK
ncbi:MAG TPA: hypothetical protein VIW25_11725 [Nitrososphaeraceae archaeon]|jgi:hypothetical protein